MIASLYAGISGLRANATAMTVIGDNIANVNTTAFKGNRASFANVLSTSLGGDTSLRSVGRGVEFWDATTQWTQGSLENTSSPTDLAVNGKGFFIVEDPMGSSFYTRAGQFQFDKNGYMVNPDGYRLQGYQIDSSGNLGSLTDIYIPGERISPPAASTEMSLDINLNADAAVNETFSATQTVYDSLGNAIPLTLTFTRAAAAGTWTVSGSIPTTVGTGVTIGGAPTMTIQFDANGNMAVPAALPNPQIDLTLTNGSATPLNVTWALFDPDGNSYKDLTGYSSESVATFQYQNGYPAGTLRTISVDESGMVTASYSNGEMTPMFQVALADFPSYEGLSKMGGNLYAESMASGQALPGIAGTGRLGSIAPSCVEMSNVDLAQEFVKMITTQRAFQANSRVITSSDEILQELINIKR
jgi:flagellar hook protein FlgE